ncbi:MAG: alanine racemase [Syntrophales bacterium]|jgi:alanine racemase|nr:alanine racemase [Syntrophales bacterium]MCK9528731.1 alanine racemase [Syntrophales bacterium]MDX9922978.1 alanine racemase [Syntrophales bacterium]
MTRNYRNWVEIDLDSFRHNWNEIRRLVGGGVRVMQVVKADAYGHGAIEISRAALKNGVFCLGVANADEGVQLRVSGISAPIVILSPPTSSEVDEIIKYSLTPCVSDPSFARELDRRCAGRNGRLPVHVEVDTGMGRGGLLYRDAVRAIEMIAGLEHVAIEGVFSHFSVSECIDDDYNHLQGRLFRELLEELEKRGINIPLKHLSNSGGVINFPEYHFNLVRPGIMTYGIHPGRETRSRVNLIPVMTFKTTILLMKEVGAGYSIGYGRTYRTKGPARIATIPVGYGDGYGAVLSNRSEALVRGRRVPVVGRISMDMCTLDVTDVPGCSVGDEVVLLGRQGSASLPAKEIAEQSSTIGYEVVCALGKRAPRVFLNRGEENAVEPRLRRIFLPEEERSIARIDAIIRSCFQARASNVEMGDAIYYEMFETLFGKGNRPLELRTGFKYLVRIRADAEGGLTAGKKERDHFRVTTRVRYTKMLRHPVFLIGCALNNRQLSALFAEERCEYRWILPSRPDHFSEEDFMVDGVRIDGREVPIISKDNTNRGLEVWCGGEGLRSSLNRRVKVEIEVSTKKLRTSNTFSVYLVYPTRGLEICFDYTGAGLRNVREVAFFAGKQTDPEVTARRGESVTLRLNDDEWVFPNSGVTFSWDLQTR